ncbi:MAG: glycosyltransferase family 39 protein, partial [Candidatus Peribacteraceae bacterium]|nr:glycosyltransferase family 39 protein [Candidatus Peribacteraceae bacterium]
GWVPILDFAIVGLLIFYSFVLWKNFAYIRRLQGVFVVMVAGIALRVLYVLATPYMLRGHDTDGHVDFIRYVFENLKLPAAHAGWEYHQAPLYYMISAMTMRISAFFGIAEDQLMGVIQVQSLLYGAGIVVIGGLLAMRLLPHATSKTERLLYCGIIASLPAFVFLSSRVTNNTLYMLLASLSFLMLIRWWKSNAVNDWYELCVILGLTTLTKASGLAIVAAVGVCWLLKNISHKHMWRQAIVGGMITVLIVGWYPLSRISDASDTEKLLTLGNGGMHGGLALQNTAPNFLTFNPLGVLEQPFNNPWGDEQRRQYFWEYFFRSAYFGEFGFHDQLRLLARGMLLFGMFGLLMMTVGLIDSFRKRDEDTIPIFVAFVFLLMAAFLYRYNFQYSANQDFRQSIVVVLPAAYFVVRGLSYLQSKIRVKWINRAMFWMLTFGILANATFILLLFWYR